MSNVWWREFEIFWTGISEMPTDNTGPDQRCVKVHVIHKDIYIYIVHEIPMYYIHPIENVF